MAVTYEWVIEGIDAWGDIEDVHHADTYVEALKLAGHLRGVWPSVDVGLVRDVGNDVEGLTDRAWAYVVDGKLPETFNYGGADEELGIPDQDSGIPVPKRFHAEVAKA
jgi:hypothetical protein